MRRAIHVRHVPTELHRRLKARAALACMSLSGYLLSEMRTIAERTSLLDMRERLRDREAVALPITAATAVREERGSR